MENVNILVYAEPIMFLEQVEKNSDMLGSLSAHLKPLCAVNKRKYKFWIVCNEFQTVDSDAFGCDTEIIMVTQRELTDNWKYESFKLIAQWHTGEYSAEMFNYYCGLFQSKITIEPDIIFTVYSAPFLEKLYKNALLLRLSAGIVSRSPYPHTASFYVGDTSLIWSKHFNKYWDRIKHLHQLANTSRELIAKFKLKCREILLNKSPYRVLVKKYREMFKYLYIFVFTAPYHVGMLTQNKYHSEFHMLLDVLDNAPDNVGIIVTKHPRFISYFDAETIDFLKGRYCNLLFDESFDEYFSASQFLLPEVDGVISMVTSVATQAMIYDKKIVSFSDSFLKGICDSSSVASFIDTLDVKATNKDDLLYWSLTRAFPSAKYYSDPDWLDAFFMSSLSKHKNQDFENFYDLIDDPEVVINHLIDNLDENIPKQTYKMRSGDKERVYNIRHNIPVEFSKEVVFSSTSIGAFYLVSGFSAPETTHTWTISESAKLELPIANIETDVEVVIRGHKLSPKQITEVMANGSSLGNIDEYESIFLIKSPDLRNQKYLKITLLSPRLYSPMELGLNSDSRKLGFALCSIMIRYGQ